MTRYERKLRDAIVQAALDCDEAVKLEEALAPGDDSDPWGEANDRLWAAVVELRKATVGKVFVNGGRRRGAPFHPRAAEIVAEAKRGELTAIQIAAKYGCHRNTVYYLLSRAREASEIFGVEKQGGRST